MKEFQTKPGGRYIFLEDFLNLQELMISSSALFLDCGRDFVVSGVKLRNGLYSPGYVWLGGKLRYFSGTYFGNNNGVAYIVPKDTEIHPVKQQEDDTPPDVRPDVLLSASNSDDVEYDDSKILSVNFEASIVFSKPSKGPYIQSNSAGFFTKVSDIWAFWNQYAFTKVRVGVSTDNQYFGDSINFKGGIDLSAVKFGDFTIDTLANSLKMVNFHQNPRGAKPSPYKKRPYFIIRKDGAIQMCSGDAYGIDAETIIEIGTSSSGAAIELDNILAKALTGNSGSLLKSSVIYIGGQNILDRYFTIEKYGDTGWLPIIDTNTSKAVSGLYARRIHCNIYIQGTLPADFLYAKNMSFSFRYVTHYKLPDSIPLPKELNILHLHTIGYCKLQQQYENEVTCTVGCAVMLDKNGNFVIAQDKENGRSDTMYDNSFPVFDYYSLRPLSYPDGVVVNVSWQYAIDAPLSAELVEYRTGGAIKYNPDDRIIHCFNSTSKYINGTRVSYTEHNVVKIECNSGGTDRWLDVPIVIGYDTVRYRKYSGGYIWTTKESSGYRYNSEDYFSRESASKVRVTYDNGAVQELDIIDAPPTHHVSIHCPMSDHWEYQIPGDGRQQAIRPYIINKRVFYYEQDVINSSGSYTINNGEEDDGALRFVVGEEYIKKVDDHYEWTEAALFAKEPFIVSVRQVESGKVSAIMVDPTKYKLSNNTEFINYS